MSPVVSVDQVMDFIQQVRKPGAAYCTNFFPEQRKLQSWIAQGELWAEKCCDAIFFLRRDIDFSHLYFGAAGTAALQQAMAVWPQRQDESIVADLVGREPDLSEAIATLEGNNFRIYRKLCRMARMHEIPSQPLRAPGYTVTTAEPGDSLSILHLLRSSFDAYAKQLPADYEVDTAVKSGQVIIARQSGALAGLLFFETQGLTSTLRYWLVTEPFRSLGIGSALMSEYFTSQASVRRFVLWADAQNKGAMRKYFHYGFVQDGLVDYVLANANVYL